MRVMKAMARYTLIIAVGVSVMPVIVYSLWLLIPFVRDAQVTIHNLSVQTPILIVNNIDNKRQYDLNKEHFRSNPPPSTTASTMETTIAGVTVRVYRPAGSKGVLPGIVFFHGGGWVKGSMDGTVHRIVSSLCQQTNAVFLSVNYSVPAIFPRAFYECVNVTKYFLSHAKEFNVDPNRIGIVGQSAGGNLAAAVALKLRDDSFQPTIKLQVLSVPVLQCLDFQLPSMMQFRYGPQLSANEMAYYTSMYLEGNSKNQNRFLNNEHVSSAAKKEFAKYYLNVNRLPSEYLKGYNRTDMKYGDDEFYDRLKAKLLNPYFAPLVATTLLRLPPTLVCTAEKDPLRDDGFLYVWRLHEAAVKVEHTHSKTDGHRFTRKCTLAAQKFILNWL